MATGIAIGMYSSPSEGVTNYLVNAALTDIGTYAFAGGFGSIVPSPAPYRGGTIQSVTGGRAGTAEDFRIAIAIGADPGQNYFQALHVVRSSGVTQTYFSNSLKFYGYSGGAASWVWGDGTNLVWSAAGAFPLILIQ